jgi:hypothetical protein
MDSSVFFQYASCTATEGDGRLLGDLRNEVRIVLSGHERSSTAPGEL